MRETSVSIRPPKKIMTSILEERDILKELCRYCNKSTLSRLCRVSSGINHFVTNILYEAIDFNLKDSPGSRQSFMDRIKALRSSSSTFMITKLDFQFLPPDSGPKASEEEKQSHISVSSSLVKNCPKLRSLNIVDRWYVSRPALRDLEESLHHTPNLGILSINLQPSVWSEYCIGQHDINVSMLIQAVQLPNVNSIALTLQEGPECLLRTSKLHTSSTITELKLDEAIVSMDTLAIILSTMPGLTHLSLDLVIYADPVYDHQDSFLDCRELGETITRYCPALENLKIAVQFHAISALDVGSGDGENGEWGVVHKFDSLQCFQRIRKLELAPEVLLGWKKEDSGQLVDLLPTSLRSLYFRWDFGTWLLSPWSFSALCEIIVDFLSPTVELKLEDLTLTYFEDDLEEIKDSLDSVQNRCGELGIRFYLNTIPYY